MRSSAPDVVHPMPLGLVPDIWLLILDLFDHPDLFDCAYRAPFSTPFSQHDFSSHAQWQQLRARQHAYCTLSVVSRAWRAFFTPMLYESVSARGPELKQLLRTLADGGKVNVRLVQQIRRVDVDFEPCEWDEKAGMAEKLAVVVRALGEVRVFRHSGLISGRFDLFGSLMTLHAGSLRKLVLVKRDNVTFINGYFHGWRTQWLNTNQFGFRAQLFKYRRDTRR